MIIRFYRKKQTLIERKLFGNGRVRRKSSGVFGRRGEQSPAHFVLQARTSMVDGFPYKEEVGGSSPSVPTNGLKI